MVAHLGRRLREHVQPTEPLPERLPRVDHPRAVALAASSSGDGSPQARRRARQVVRVVRPSERASARARPARDGRRVERVRVVLRGRDREPDILVVVVVVVVAHGGPVEAAAPAATRAGRCGAVAAAGGVLLRRGVGELHEAVEAVEASRGAVFPAAAERRGQREAVRPVVPRSEDVLCVVRDRLRQRHAVDAVDVREGLARVEEELGLCVAEGDAAGFGARRGRGRGLRGGRGGEGDLVVEGDERGAVQEVGAEAAQLVREALRVGLGDVELVRAARVVSVRSA